MEEIGGKELRWSGGMKARWRLAEKPGQRDWEWGWETDLEGETRMRRLRSEDKDCIGKGNGTETRSQE